MKKKIFLVFILFLTWLNYLLSYEYVKIMMDTACLLYTSHLHLYVDYLHRYDALVTIYVENL